MVMQILPEMLPLTQVKQAGRRLFQKKPIRKVVKEMTDTASHLWEKGWAERNAGNISVNVTGLVPAGELQKLPSFPFLPMPRPFPSLEKKVFLVTLTGSRMRDLAENPEENLCFIYISENGSAYHIVAASDVTEGIRPTSELLTHLAIHQMLIHTKRPELAVVHAHVTELIALSHIPGLNSEEAVNNLLWGMHPETKMFVPDGAGYVPFEVPGSETLARSTVKAFESHQAVIWEKHGCMAIAESVPDAFDTLDILAKAARIWFLVKGATGG
jgi:rhamnulose-1-phosphate aldolase